MKSKLKFILPLVVLVGGLVGYTFFFTEEPAESKVHGQVYVLPKEFTLNLHGGRFLKVGVGLIVAKDDPGLQAASAGGSAPPPPEGYGPAPQEALVRDIVTDNLTGKTAEDLIDGERREKLKHAIAKDLNKKTDLHVEEVLFTDVAVQ